MARYDHMIMRLRLEVSVHDKKLQSSIQRTIQHIFQNQIHPILEQIFAAHVPADVLITLNQVHIDLGELDLKNVEKSIFQQIQRKLPTAIRDQVEWAIQDPLKKHIVPLEQAKIEAIQYYLTKGYFAWWMPLTSPEAIENLYIAFMQESPQAIQRLWLELNPTPSAIKRLGSQFHLSTVKKTIQILETKHGRYVTDLADDMVFLQQQIDWPAKQVEMEKEALVWSMLMEQVLHKHASKFNELDLVQGLLKKLAQAYKIDYQNLLVKLRQLLSYHASQKMKSGLFENILQLYDALIPTQRPVEEKADQLPVLIKQLDKALVQTETADFPSIIASMLDMPQKPTIKRLFEGYLQSPTYTYRLIDALSHEHTASLVACLKPSIKDVFVMVDRLWNQLIDSGIANKPFMHKRIIQLTINYLQRAGGQEPQSYLSYVWNKLALYQADALLTLHNWLTSKQNLQQSADDHQLRNWLLTTLEEAINQPNRLKKDINGQEQQSLSNKPASETHTMDKTSPALQQTGENIADDFSKNAFNTPVMPAQPADTYNQELSMATTSPSLKDKALVDGMVSNSEADNEVSNKPTNKAESIEENREKQVANMHESTPGNRDSYQAARQDLHAFPIVDQSVDFTTEGAMPIDLSSIHILIQFLSEWIAESKLGKKYTIDEAIEGLSADFQAGLDTEMVDERSVGIAPSSGGYDQLAEATKENPVPGHPAGMVEQPLPKVPADKPALEEASLLASQEKDTVHGLQDIALSSTSATHPMTTLENDDHLSAAQETTDLLSATQEITESSSENTSKSNTKKVVEVDQKDLINEPKKNVSAEQGLPKQAARGIVNFDSIDTAAHEQVSILQGVGDITAPVKDQSNEYIEQAVVPTQIIHSDKILDQLLVKRLIAYSQEKGIWPKVYDLNIFIPVLLGVIQQKPAAWEQPILIESLKRLWGALEPIITSRRGIHHSKQEDIKEAFHSLLVASIEDETLLKKLSGQLHSWVKQLVTGNQSTNRSALEIIQKQLEPLLHAIQRRDQPTGSAPSIQEIEAFLVDHFLPDSYTSSAEWIQSMIAETTYLASTKYALLNLLKQNLPRQNFIDYALQGANLEVLRPLLPLSSLLFNHYTQLLLRADVLRAGTMIEKKKVLADIFLKTLSQVPDALETQFIQLSILTLSQESQLTKQELYRRINEVAQKQGTHIAIRYALDPLLSDANPVSHTIADSLDLALLPIYQSVKSFFASPDAMLQFHSILLPAMKDLVRQKKNTADIEQTIDQLIKKALPEVAAREHQALIGILIQSLEDLTIDYQKQVKETWLHFLHTGELRGSARHINQLLDELSMLPAAELEQTLKETMKDAHARKRLVGRLTGENLQQLIYLLPFESADGLVQAMDRVKALWDYAGIKTLPDSLILATWWEIGLINLAHLMGPSFSLKTWLATSIAALSDSLQLHPSSLLWSLQRAMQAMPPTTVSGQECDQLLKVIQQDLSQEMHQAAEQVWPAQPDLQALHRLLTVGLSAFADGGVSSIPQIEENILLRIKEQDEAIQQILYNQPQPIVVARRLVYYLHSELIDTLIQYLSGSFYPVIQTYWRLIDWTMKPPNLTMDKDTWRRYHEVAILTVLLTHKSTFSSSSQWLQKLLPVLNQELKQDVSDIFRQLIKVHQGQAAYQELSQNITAVLAAQHPEQSASVQVLHPADEVALGQEFGKKNKGEQEVKIYIKNSGIIFLWPLIEDLFVQQHLMKKQAFADTVAANNALHTLQYLVTDTLRTPDWRLILNKLLCGLAYDEITYVGYYLEDERKLATAVLKELVQQETKKDPKNDQYEQHSSIKGWIEKIPAEKLPADIQLLEQNCKNLFDIVFSTWESLKNLEKFKPYQTGFTVEDFKAYFLQREGILQWVSQGDQSYWHLTMTVEPYDSPEILPPWSIKNIRLPWMKEDLVVCWMGD